MQTVYTCSYRIDDDDNDADNGENQQFLGGQSFPHSLVGKFFRAENASDQAVGEGGLRERLKVLCYLKFKKSIK